ncbi:hypothetical protein [Spongiactinospora sp. TRM90649]|uniref:hypothetical protein n=1 Tax=Spongiactinospora sp. TRM90649 TaxID=3031114 RepID=UPI0023F8E1A6|nr:hypothetical protein [Spongiactinospora sp. TRM90649]MDF5758998.1 hypothetical protein [Spongiactinospora sp. TRM90649]
MGVGRCHMDDLSARDRAHLAALESTFPGWRITVRDGVWLAIRHDPPTDAQRDLGLQHRLTRPDPIELVHALSDQLGILAQIGAA